MGFLYFLIAGFSTARGSVNTFVIKLIIHWLSITRGHCIKQTLIKTHVEHPVEFILNKEITLVQNCIAPFKTETGIRLFDIIL
ncbi:hypothetical protein AQUCO_02200023v1 [Aquilegia coerulea]|uniref:Secreted protein n=1 Tax=Aquilegia coerulea TaxID=218851 RepID=A0A2G5DCS1_AQUCA|nr:hypothetical protein AQUCO_02200023v1 [Aquilegia coerulea]